MAVTQHGGDDPVSGSDDTAFDVLLKQAAQVSSAGPTLLPGARLCAGRFEIQRRIGEGGMGAVYQALDGVSGAPVALKTLLRVDAAGIYRMKREFRSIADVVHPRLVNLHELFADGELWFFTMGLVEGVPFERYVRAGRGALDEGRLRAALGQLAAGVQAIHEAGKLHRDLKPSNVLVAEGPALTILDFGLTTEASRSGATQTIERGVAGTPAYMAPEQAGGRAATRASDWYAVGVMLFEALTGKLPFAGDSLEQLFAKQTKAAPPVKSLAPEAPGDLAELCDGLLAMEPTARPGLGALLRDSQSQGALSTPHSSPSTGSSESSEGSGEGDGTTTLLPEAFVGRSRELGLLETALSDTNAGKPVFVMVGGPSGIGKTTFVEYFLRAAKQRGDAVVLAGRCYQRESVPYKGFDGVIDALTRHLMRLKDADAARLVPRQAQALVRVFPVLGRVDAISAAPQRRGLPSDVVELRYRAFEALKELLAKLAEERPLILSIDDLQWSDGDSARLLKHLLTPPDPPLLLLVAAFREDEPDAEGLLSVRAALSDPEARAIDVRRLELGALSAAESRRLAKQLLASDDRERIERLVREGAGSPFLIGELSRAAGKGETPGDLRAAILTRIAAQPQARRDVLHAVCVAPRPVAQEVLARVVPGVDVPAEVRALLSLQLAREVAVRDRSKTRGVLLAAYHDRIRETVLDALPSAERSGLHHRYSAALESSEPLDLDALVHHTLGAGEREKAGEYARRAGRHAAGALAFGRAVELYEVALAHLRLADGERAALLVELATAYIGGGRLADAGQKLLEAAELEPERAEELHLRAGEQFFINGDTGRGTAAMRRALEGVGLDYDALTDDSRIASDFAAAMSRGFVFTPRDASTIEPHRLKQLDTLWPLALGTAWSLSIKPQLEYVRLAIEVGEPHRLARGRAWLFAAFEAVTDPVGARARHAEVEALLSSLDTPVTRAYSALCRGMLAFSSATDDLGILELSRAEELLSDPRTQATSREVTICHSAFLVGAREGRDRVSITDHLDRWLRLADEAGDRFASIELRFAGALGYYDRFGAERVRAELQRGFGLSQRVDTNRTDYGVVLLMIVDALEGELERAAPVACNLRGIAIGRFAWGLWHRWLRAAVLLAAVARGVGDRDALLDRVERDAAVLEQPLTVVGTPLALPAFAGVAEFLRGQVAAGRGDRELARALFEAAVAKVSPEFLFLGPVFRARLGDLCGGARGAELRAEAGAVLAAAGCRPNWLELLAARL